MKTNQRKPVLDVPGWLIHNNSLFNYWSITLIICTSWANLIEAGGDPMLALRNLNKNFSTFLTFNSFGNRIWD